MVEGEEVVFREEVEVAFKEAVMMETKEMEEVSKEKSSTFN